MQHTNKILRIARAKPQLLPSQTSPFPAQDGLQCPNILTDTSQVQKPLFSVSEQKLHNNYPPFPVASTLSKHSNVRGLLSTKFTKGVQFLPVKRRHAGKLIRKSQNRKHKKPCIFLKKLHRAPQNQLEETAKGIIKAGKSFFSSSAAPW